MMFDTEHFSRCKAKSDNPDVINIVHVIANPNGSCMACVDGVATVIRRITYPYYEIDAPLCDVCSMLSRWLVQDLMFQKFTRRVEK